MERTKILVASLAISSATLLLGSLLQPRSWLWLAKYLSQSGTLNPKNLQKLQMLPSTLLMAGVVVAALTLLLFLARHRVSAILAELEMVLSSRQKVLLLLAGTQLAIILLTLSYGTASLASRFSNLGSLTNRQIIEDDYGLSAPLIQTIAREVPETESIFIYTRNDIKYLLNYDLYPRRFFFYPTAEIAPRDIPASWLDHREISWILEIDDLDPSRFHLYRRLQDSMPTRRPSP
jgi:hypothetical protein